MPMRIGEQCLRGMKRDHELEKVEESKEIGIANYVMMEYDIATYTLTMIVNNILFYG